MGTIAISCPSCGARLNVSADAAGKTIHCVRCAQGIVVSSLPATPAMGRPATPRSPAPVAAPRAQVAAPIVSVPRRRSSAGWLVAFAVVAFLLLVGTGGAVAAIVVFARPDVLSGANEQPKVAEGEQIIVIPDDLPKGGQIPVLPDDPPKVVNDGQPDARADDAPKTEKNKDGIIPTKAPAKPAPADNPTPKGNDVAPEPNQPVPVVQNDPPKAEPAQQGDNPFAIKIKRRKKDQEKKEVKDQQKKEDKGQGKKDGKLGAYRSSLTKAQQKKVNEAIDRGVKYLRDSQDPKHGHFGEKNYPVGYTSLVALTLLECGVPVNDPAIQKAASYVRFNAPGVQQHATYQLSLAIIFLDRLNDPADQNVIRRAALRLIAGQTEAGGWSYNLPVLNFKEQQELVVFLHKSRPYPVYLDKNGNPLQFPIGKDGRPQFPWSKGKDLQTPLPKDKKGGDLSTPLPKDNGGRLPGATEKSAKKDKAGGKKDLILPFDGSTKPAVTNPREEDRTKVVPANLPSPDEIKVVLVNPPPIPPQVLSKKVQKFPIVQNNPFPDQNWRQQPKGQGKGKGKFGGIKNARDDNSNTQFAMIALWCARRYGVPVERTLHRVDMRFVTSQNANGSWHYQYMGGNGTPQMTCVGLIGLAIGHGAFKDLHGPGWIDKDASKKVMEDENIKLGIEELARHVGTAPANWDQNTRMVNLYYLWSLERTAMLYNLKTIGGKDWYAWAAQQLVVNQREQGNWAGGGYHGSDAVLDTSLALLVLRRANLVEDLTQSLRLYVPLEDSGGDRR